MFKNFIVYKKKSVQLKTKLNTKPTLSTKVVKAKQKLRTLEKLIRLKRGKMETASKSASKSELGTIKILTGNSK